MVKKGPKSIFGLLVTSKTFYHQGEPPLVSQIDCHCINTKFTYTILFQITRWHMLDFVASQVKDFEFWELYIRIKKKKSVNNYSYEKYVIKESTAFKRYPQRPKGDNWGETKLKQEKSAWLIKFTQMVTFVKCWLRVKPTRLLWATHHSWITFFAYGIFVFTTQRIGKLETCLGSIQKLTL